MKRRTASRVVAAAALWVVIALVSTRTVAEEARPSPFLTIRLAGYVGTIDRSYYEALLQRHVTQLERCLAPQRTSVTVTLRIVVSPTGRVLAVDLVSGTLPPDIHQCLVDGITAVDFRTCSSRNGTSIIHLTLISTSRTARP